MRAPAALSCSVWFDGGSLKTTAIGPPAARSASSCPAWLGRRKTLTCCPSALMCVPTARIRLGRSWASREATMAEMPLSTRAIWAGLSSAGMVLAIVCGQARKRRRVRASASQ